MSKAKTKTVTYIGPVDASDPSASYLLPGVKEGEQDLQLTKGIPVHDVTAAQFSRLQDDDAHRFGEGEIDVADPAAGAPWPDYGTLNAEDVVARIGDPQSTPDAAFARRVAAFEAEHGGNRSTVIEAAEHQAVAYDPAAAEEGSASDGNG